MNTICNNFTEVILNTFKNEQEERRELGMKLKQKDVEIKNLLETIINLKTSNSDLINKSITLVTKNKELESKHTEISEELTNFNKVSLLKNIHMKYDKMKNKNEVLKKRVNYYKKKALNQISKEDIIDLTSISSEQDDIVNIILSTEEYKTNDSIKKDVVIKKETIDITNEGEGVKEEKCNVSDGVDKLEKNNEKEVDVGEEEDVGEEVEEEEVGEEEEVEVELVKINRRYYYVEDSDTKIVYKAIKIKKGEYDIGDKLGYLEDDKIIKD